MPKADKKKKNNPLPLSKRELICKEEEQEYALITKVLGNGRMEGKCFDNVTRICHIRGTMKKKAWIKVNDVVLISLRDFETKDEDKKEKCDIIHLYNEEEVRELKKLGELPENLADPTGLRNNDIDIDNISFEDL